MCLLLLNENRRDATRKRSEGVTIKCMALSQTQFSSNPSVLVVEKHIHDCMAKRADPRACKKAVGFNQEHEARKLNFVQ